MKFLAEPNWPMVFIAYLLTTAMLCAQAFQAGRIHEQCKPTVAEASK